VKKKLYNILLLKKKLKRNDSINQISQLNKEKIISDEAIKVLNELLEGSKFHDGELLTTDEVITKSKYHSEIHKRIEVSNNRSVFLKKEIRQGLVKLNQINKQKEIISEKIKNIDKENLKKKDQKSELTNINRLK